MGGERDAGPLPERRRNALLREVDWRFLLRQQEVPRAVDLRSEEVSPALGLVTEPAPGEPGAADLAVIGHPTRAALRSARQALRPGGELASLWRVPTPAGAGRARRRLERAGFSEVRLYWPGPLPRKPEFWLPLDSPAALAHVLGLRPVQSRLQAALRPLWRAIARTGSLAPLCAVARAPGAGAERPDRADELESLLDGPQSWALLTGGKRSINKVVALAFAEGREKPAAVVKLARVPEVEAGLEHEAKVLRWLEHDRPGVPGVPRLQAIARRAGRLALAESAIHGQPMLPVLTPETFEDFAWRVTRWLLDLAANGSSRQDAEWRARLVERPLDDFERCFGGAVGTRSIESARRILGGLDHLPQVPEHRDCSQWNVILTADGAPAFVDWESAEPHGLPALDLTYFLAFAAFMLDGSFESGRTRESYARLLDTASPAGTVATACLDQYSSRLGLEPDTLARLRLLCWIVHSLSEYRHIEMETGAPPQASDLRDGVFPGLVEEELRRFGKGPR